MTEETQEQEQPRERPTFDEWKADIELRAMQHAPNLERYLLLGGILFMLVMALAESR